MPDFVDQWRGLPNPNDWNFDEHGNPLARPNTLLIDSEEIESGDALDDNFRAMSADEIDRFRREIIE